MAKMSFPVSQDDNPALCQGNGETPESLDCFQKAMNRFIDDFFTNFDLLPLSVFEDAGKIIPRIFVSHDTKNIIITAELPGMDAEDIEVTLVADALVIEGERKKVKQGRRIDFTAYEYGPGIFRRMIPIPFRFDAQNATASFKNRVLQVTLPRYTEDPHARMRIPIKV